jgi:excinuclease ABC subunit C
MALPEYLKEAFAALPGQPGVYLFKDETGAELYVGKAKNLRKRVRQYFDDKRPAARKTADLVARIRGIEFIECQSEVEAFLLENRLIKDFQPPFNFFNKSDINFPVVEITWNEDFPRVLVTRDRSGKQGKCYGPFVNTSWLRAALRILQRAFRYRTCHLEIRSGDPRQRFVRPCLEFYIGRCRAPCAGRQGMEEYRSELKRLALFLSGKGQEVRKEVEERMWAASRERRFEEAAAFRDTLKALESLGQRGSLKDNLEPGLLHIDPKEGVDRLQEVLGLPRPPERIEGFDIAHLQGTEMVGALVSFAGGMPCREEYRRYKIRTVEGIDDFASIREVVFRRYTRQKEEGWLLPDLILIDGGLGQLHAAGEGLRQAGAEGPCLTALAKQEERLFTFSHPEGLRLPRRSSALRLLQYVRDEAHRFAQHYHHILRRKRLLDHD